MKLKSPQLRYGVNTGLQLTEYEAQDIDCVQPPPPLGKRIGKGATIREEEYMLWFNFILGLNFIFLCFKVI